MQPLSSQLESKELPFDEALERLAPLGFALGGGWDYKAGSFDRPLEEARKVWLRLPFEVTSGTLDGESDMTDAVIRFGTPFALRHQYEEGLDGEAQPRAVGALVDQFQEPSDPDAPLDAADAGRAESALRQAEERLQAR